MMECKRCGRELKQGKYSKEWYCTCIILLEPKENKQ